MKILRISAYLYPSTIGGLDIHTHDMSRMQAEMGHDVTVFTQKWNSDEPINEEKYGYKIKRFEPNMMIFGNPIFLNMLNDLNHVFDDYDIVHTHSHLFFYTNLSVLLKYFKKTPLVITNHGLVSQTAPIWFSNLYNKTLGKWTFNGADMIISYSEDEKEKMKQLGITTSIKIIHNGVDTDKFKPLPKVKKKNQILWVGRFMPGKAVQYLLKAFAILKKEDPIPGLKLKLVGDGPSKNDLMLKAKKLGIYDDIIFIESVPNKKIPELYNESKVFALSSLTEGVPRTVLESLSCGTPVVSTNLPQITSIVNGCGYIVPQKDSKALAQSIKTVLTDEDKRKELGKSATKKIEEHYSWKDTVERTVGLYENILKTN